MRVFVRSKCVSLFVSLIVRWCTNRGTMVPLLGEKFPWFDEFDGALSVLQDRTLFDIMA